MDNESFVPQSTGGYVREGHEESDLSVKGIVISGVGLALCGFLSFALMGLFLKGLPTMQRWVFGTPQPLTPVQQQLQQERAALAPQKGVVQEGQPEWYAPPASAVARGEMEAHLDKTFPTPRLQYDDVRDMTTFRASEEEWLSSAGRDAQGNIHISIDSAMDLIAKQGLPPVSGPYVPPTLPAAVPLVPAPAATKK
ncbi:MAG TPA: hypothetical protein VKL40_17985 [Candidatus Angelobacter sp.]|nr:hypothetical protein [Candidatus Angelobacter sp.]